MGKAQPLNMIPEEATLWRDRKSRSRRRLWQGRRDAASFACLCKAGLRRQEVILLDLADYDAEMGALRVGRGLFLGSATAPPVPRAARARLRELPTPAAAPESQRSHARTKSLPGEDHDRHDRNRPTDQFSLGHSANLWVGPMNLLRSYRTCV